MALAVSQFLCLADNFGLILRDPSGTAAASIDAPEGAAIVAAARAQDLRLTHLLLTHHHMDHVQGTEQLRQSFPGLVVVGAAKDAHRLPPLDIAVAEGDEIAVGAARARVIETPGHTLGHIAYHFEAGETLFVGDTLFSLGCGRVFEGTMEQMYGSLEKLAALPPETRVYCGHEYTMANARFALSVDPDNTLLQGRAKEVEAKRGRGEFTLPTTIALENATNPFLRVDAPALRARLGLPHATGAAVFARLRRMKDAFQG